MPKTRKETVKAIIKAHRERGFIIVSLPFLDDPTDGKKQVRNFGPINIARQEREKTLYGYESDIDYLAVHQFINKKIKTPKPDIRQNEPTVRTKERQKEIEHALVQAYGYGAQFIIGLEPVDSENQAMREINMFGTPTKHKASDGRISYIVDDLDNQIKVYCNVNK